MSQRQDLHKLTGAMLVCLVSLCLFLATIIIWRILTGQWTIEDTIDLLVHLTVASIAHIVVWIVIRILTHWPDRSA